MRLIAHEDGRELFAAVARAESAADRMKGLLGRDGLAPGEGLFIPDCGSIHTFFMRFAIDIVFLDRAMRVRRIVPRLGPWRLTTCFGAAHVIEVGAGAAEAAGMREGMSLALEP